MHHLGWSTLTFCFTVGRTRQVLFVWLPTYD